MISKFTELNDYDWLYQKYHVENATMSEIAEIVGCSLTMVFRAMKSHGIELSNTIFRHHPKLSDEKWVYEKYIIDEKSASEIAASIGCELTLVYRSLETHNIKKRTLSEAQLCKHHIPELLNKEWVYQKYCIEGMTQKEISNLLGCDQLKIRSAMERFGIKCRPKIRHPELHDEKWLYEKYVVDGLNASEIANLLGCTDSAVRSAMQRHDIKIRAWSDKRPHQLNNYTWLKQKYIDEQQSATQIAVLLDCNPTAVTMALDRNDVKRRTFLESISGKFNPNWQGGISFEPYCVKFKESLKERVRNKFGRKCLLCSKTEKEQMDDQIKHGKRSQRLSIHHVNYHKNCGCDGTNCILVPLCSSCHAKTNSNRDFWENKIMEILNTQYPQFIDG